MEWEGLNGQSNRRPGESLRESAGLTPHRADDRRAATNHRGPDHSARNATNGSMRLARRAGTQQASKATAASSATTAE